MVGPKITKNWVFIITLKNVELPLLFTFHVNVRLQKWHKNQSEKQSLVFNKKIVSPSSHSHPLSFDWSHQFYSLVACAHSLLFQGLIIRDYRTLHGCSECITKSNTKGDTHFIHAPKRGESLEYGPILDGKRLDM